MMIAVYLSFLYSSSFHNILYCTLLQQPYKVQSVAVFLGSLATMLASLNPII